MKRILEEEDIQLTKSLGQNFLHDANQLRKIIEAADLKKTDKVLEIGPGLGPLTELLAENAGEVLAIEKDRRLVEVLTNRFGLAEPAPSSPDAPRGNIRLIHDDALEWLKRERQDWAEWKLVANLPYSVASPILVELAQASSPPERMVVTLQLEVAKRLMAKSGGADYGILSLLVQLQFEPRGFHKIPASCFFPEPDVDSAFVSLVRRERPLLDAAGRVRFSRIVKLAFSQRRKMMMKLLKMNWRGEELLREFERAGVPPDTRAEKVSLDQFVELTKGLEPRNTNAD